VNEQTADAHADPHGANRHNAFFDQLVRFLGKVARQR